VGKNGVGRQILSRRTGHGRLSSLTAGVSGARRRFTGLVPTEGIKYALKRHAPVAVCII